METGAAQGVGGPESPCRPDGAAGRDASITSPASLQAMADDVVRLAVDLIRIDSSNPTSTERRAAEHVAGELSEMGLEPRLTESEPGRASLVARWPGADPRAPALLVHHHLDVVPADPSDWTVPPFAGEVRDGCVWGRGAVDMKGSVAATLAAVRSLRRAGVTPARDVVLAFSADEEAGGRLGVKHLVRALPDHFTGVSEAIGEVGGFSLPLPDGRRIYPVQVAEKGQAWMRLTAYGHAGHGSMMAPDNPVVTMSRVLDRIGSHRFPTRLVPASRALLEAVAAAHGLQLDPDDPRPVLQVLGPLAKMIEPTTRHTANPTMVTGGYQVNVVPERVVAHVDGRFLPGLEDDFTEAIDAIVGTDAVREWIHHDVAVETELTGSFADAMRAALTAEDPDADLVPYCMPGATDAKTYSTLGIRCYGFMPLRLPPQLDFAAMFHGVDERVPVESLEFSARVLRRLFGSQEQAQQTA
jgi:acetylornithine deacetylase/succinyl-diaminopimelate desuccinylase-like protein